MDNISIVSVVNNDSELNFYYSIRRFYPIINVVIVDLSQKDSEINKLLTKIKDINTTIIYGLEHVGYGYGLHFGILEASKKSLYVVLFDSKVEIIKSGAVEMLFFEIKGRYGVGSVVKTDDIGQYNKDGAISSLMTYFCMISLLEYCKYPKLENYPVPLFRAMNYLSNNNLQHKLKNVELTDYVKNGTSIVRFINYNEHLLNWW